MKFNKTLIEGAYVIELEKREDERGFLARTWCKKEFSEHGIDADLVQGYVAWSKKKGTVRGIHYQIPPMAEAKLTRCTKGAIYEVIIDVRSSSKTYKKWIGLEFKESDNKMLFTPQNVAHGYVTLTDNTEIVNLSTTAYSLEFEKGIRFNDPSFKIPWPVPMKHISKKDQAWENFT